MFSIGEYVVYGVEGVCRVEEAGKLKVAGLDKNRAYYRLRPYYHDGTIYTPVDGKAVMRPVLTREELENYRLEGTDERIPLFDEVLALFENTTPLIIELKAANGNHFALSKAVCERLDSYKGVFCIESFDPMVVADVRELRPGICRGQLAENFLKDKGALDPVRSVLATGLIGNALAKPDFIAFKFEDRSCILRLQAQRLLLES